ncbi:MAG: hypothetical protein Fur0037_09110 [Planctomycetota bacterium]
MSLGREVPHLLTTWARFTMLLPFLLVVLAAASLAWPWPELDLSFFGWTAGCALFQSLSNLCLVAAFRWIPFSRVAVFAKLEVAMTPLVGLLFFSEVPSVGAGIGIALCLAGALALSRAGRGGRASAPPARGVLLSLAAAASVVFASFLLKKATAEFVSANRDLSDGPAHFLAAVHVLVNASWMQAAVLLVWIRVRAPHQLRFLATHRRGMLRLGAAAAVCSTCWFWAYSLQQVAYVKAVGQIEMVVVVLFSHFLLGERDLRKQLPAMGVVLCGILLVLLGG